MRFPLKRGIPKVYSAAGTDTFEYPVTDPTYTSETRVTIFARNTTPATTTPLLIPNVGANYTFPANKYTATKLFDRIVRANLEIEVNSDAALIYGHLELGPFQNQNPNAPLIGARGPAPTFNITPVQIFKNGPETLVHSLDKNFMDLVTLKVNVPATASITFRFYDGTYTAGVANYESYTLFETSSGPETLFEAHPMSGPGKITVVRTEAADTYVDAVSVYGAYVRNG